MKRLLILTVALMVGAGCTGRKHEVPALSNAGQSQSAPPPQWEKNREAISNEAEKTKDVPIPFRTIDFENISYPTSEEGAIRLKNGVYQRREGAGGITIDLRDVHYADLSGNSEQEAIVQLLQVMCGGSCDGSSSLFYFFSVKHGKLTLLSHIETGSIAYTCGLKSFTLSKRTLTLEAFRKCSFDGVSLKSAYDADSVGGKFVANEFTRFKLAFEGRRFVQKKRELIPNPENNVKNYPVQVSITND